MTITTWLGRTPCAMVIATRIRTRGDMSVRYNLAYETQAYEEILEDRGWEVKEAAQRRCAFLLQRNGSSRSILHSFHSAHTASGECNAIAGDKTAL
jgi:hypothetical protein